MLKNFAFRRVGGEVVEVFHQNGTPPFYQLYLMHAKRKVSSLQPPKSPDLTPLDFLFWGCIKA